jgi:hypothetical protein
MTLSDAERAELRRARERLESPGLAIRITDLLGQPIERAFALLPEPARGALRVAVSKSLDRALDVALATTRAGAGEPAREGLHKVAGITTGAVGGFFGLPGLVVELPVTTVLMLRSIADVARSEGHDLTEAATRVSCLEVFALGGTTRADDAVETGYFAVRAALAGVVRDAARHIAEHGLAARGAPALVRLVQRIAVRFGIAVEQKVALELLPVVGALSGAAINAIFLDHFQGVARGHFVVRRLEKLHGTEAVRAAWDSA